LLGPAGVGKTSLVTALLAEFQPLLAGTSVVIRAGDRETEEKIVRKRQEIQGDLLAGEFSPAGLSATAVPFTFTLKLDPGAPESEISIELLDFPAAWLSMGAGTPSRMWR
jgi:MoxR-like ATPase